LLLVTYPFNFNYFSFSPNITLNYGGGHKGQVDGFKQFKLL